MASYSTAPDPTKPITFSAVFKNVSPPTVVDRCLYCNLLNAKSRNLVITRSCYIDIYTLKNGEGDTKFLNWVHTACVFEEICDIVSVRFVGDELDSLILSFSEAKVAIIGFDAATYELKTLSLHNYEYENLKSGRINFSKLPILRVDPLHRCAVLLVYDRHLAVLPFRRCETIIAKDNAVTKSVTRRSSVSWERRSTAPLLATFTTCLSSSTGEKINNVIDMQFLHGFYEPTLLVLYESIGTWAGRVSARRDTCCIVALSFNLQKRTNPVIWFQESLPYDCHSVHSIPQPIGGVVILATNSIIYLKQTLPSCGLPLNCYAQIATNFPMRQETPPACGPLTLDGCRTLTVGDSQLLLVAGTGKIYSLSLWLEQATQTVTNLLLHEVGFSVPPYCITLAEPGCLFIGSRLCDSVLLHFNLGTILVSKTGELVQLGGNPGVLKQVSVSPTQCTVTGHQTKENQVDEAETADVDERMHCLATPANNDEESSDVAVVNRTTDSADTTTQSVFAFGGDDVDLYGPSILQPPSNYREIYDFKFQIMDRLVNFGPMSLITSGEVACLAPGNTDPSDEALVAAQADMQHVELIATVPRGHGLTDFTDVTDLRSGGLLFLHSTVRPRGLTAFELPEYVSLWALYGPPIANLAPSQKKINGEKEASESVVSQDQGDIEEAEVINCELPSTGSTKLEELETTGDEKAVDEQPPPSKLARLDGECETTVNTVVPEGLDTAAHSATLINGQPVPDENETKSSECISLTTAASEKRDDAGEAQPSDAECGPRHSYLLLTREDSTMILEVSHEIVELEVSGFNTTEMTVAAVNLGGVYIAEKKGAPATPCSPSVTKSTGGIAAVDAALDPATLDSPKPRVGIHYPYILQVSPTSLRLLDGPQLVEYIQVTFEWRIHLASSADPYVLMCTEEDELFLVRLRPPLTDEDGDPSAPWNRSTPAGQVKRPHFLNLKNVENENRWTAGECGQVFASTPRLDIIRPKVRQVSAPSCFCLYRDRAGHLKRWLWARRTPKFNNAPGGFNGHLLTDANLMSPSSHRQQQHAGFFPPPPSSSTIGTGETGFSKKVTKANSLSAADEEDLLLYGELIDICKQERVFEGSNFMREQPPPASETRSSPVKEFGRVVGSGDTDFGINDDGHSTFAFIVFTNGVLEVYSVPEFTLLYEVHEFSDFPSMLYDHRVSTHYEEVSSRPQISQPVTPGPGPPKGSIGVMSTEDEELFAPPVLEITVFPVGRNHDRPVLIARSNQEVAFFEALCPPVGECHPFVTNSASEEQLRWRRLPIPCLLTAPRRVRADPKIADVHATLLTRNNLLRPFEDIGGHRGVFVCGSCPMWLFSTDSGHLRTFPHANDGIMGSFSSLNTTICPKGFVYFTYTNEMRLATLPPGYSFRENMGMRRVPLDINPHFVQYHVESKTYAVIGTRSSYCSSVFRLTAEGNKEEEPLPRPKNCALPILHHYRLQMYASTISAKASTGNRHNFFTSTCDPGLLPIPNAELEFEPWEVVTTVVTAQLASEQTFHGTKDYLAIGANLSYGEEIPVRGRIVILDLIDVVPEPGQPLTRHKLKTIYDGEQKGPVTALASCQGHLLSAIGQKVYIWTLKNGDLVGVAFVDSELHIHSLLCVKNLVLAADVLKSVQVLRFQSDLRVLSVVTRDSIPREVYTCNFFVDGRRLGFLVTDEYGNVVIYSYDPLDPTSRSGRHLVRRVDMCLPGLATTSLRISNRLRHALTSVKPAMLPTAAGTTVLSSTDNATPAPVETTAANQVKTTAAKTSGTSASTAVLNPGVGWGQDAERLRHSVYLGTQTGAVYLLSPIRDKMYSRLRITEKNLLHHLGPTCGLLPRLCRPYRPPHPELVNPCGQMADADLLWRYLVLPHSQRLEIAQKSGQSLEGIMDDIAELSATTLHF